MININDMVLDNVKYNVYLVELINNTTTTLLIGSKLNCLWLFLLLYQFLAATAAQEAHLYCNIACNVTCNNA